MQQKVSAYILPKRSRNASLSDNEVAHPWHSQTLQQKAGKARPFCLGQHDEHQVGKGRAGQGARLFGRLVAPMTMTCARDFSPSISVSSCDTMRRSTSPCHDAMLPRQGF